MFKLLKSDNCNSIMYYGIGYDEPNYGRDQYFIYPILKMEKEHSGRDNFFGNMGEPTKLKEYFSKLCCIST